MSNNGIASVYHSGVVAALVEHTHIDAQVVCQVYGAVHGALVRADNHQMLFVNFQVFIMAEKSLDKLIGGHKVVKAV